MLEMKYPPGSNIRITQYLELRGSVIEKQTEGTVESWEDLPTGSWFAHGKNDRYWLKRLRIRKPDGEIALIVIDATTHITNSPGTPTAAS
ncbi:MAG: hypothetical protein J5J06_06660 [Phycisphaerae bacterium]|nr:hypothetical protein [Phycisphaerae bacterium]